MTDTTEPAPPPAKPAGRGHIASIKGRAIPWGFSDPKKEGRAAKKHGIDYPGTAKKEES